MDAHLIISKKSADLIRGKYGLYSGIDPMDLPDGMYFLPEKCLHDSDLEEIKKTLEGIKKECKIQIITEVKEKEMVEKDKYYITEFGLAKCISSGEVKDVSKTDTKIFNYGAIQSL